MVATKMRPHSLLRLERAWVRRPRGQPLAAGDEFVRERMAERAAPHSARAGNGNIREREMGPRRKRIVAEHVSRMAQGPLDAFFLRKADRLDLVRQAHFLALPNHALGAHPARKIVNSDHRLAPCFREIASKTSFAVAILSLIHI